MLTDEELEQARADFRVEELPRLDDDPPGDLVFVHYRSCPNFCEYSCGGSFYWIRDGRITKTRAH